MQVWGVSLLAVCAVSAQAAELKLEIDGCIPGEEVRVALYSSAKDFPGDGEGWNALRKLTVKAVAGAVHLSFADVAPGRYAVAAFVDRNGNQRLDRNFVGTPTEPYGFSRDARNWFSAPGFAQAAFAVGEGSVAQFIHLK